MQGKMKVEEFMPNLLFQHRDHLVLVLVITQRYVPNQVHNACSHSLSRARRYISMDIPECIEQFRLKLEPILPILSMCHQVRLYIWFHQITSVT